MVEQTNTDLFRSISYSLDNGKTWNTVQNIDYDIVNVDVAVNVGDKILWKGDGISLCMDPGDPEMGIDLYGSFFSSTNQFNVEGNIMSLLYGDNFSNKTTLNVGFEFAALFYDGWGNGRKAKLVSAENLILPATALSTSCYDSMFYGCTTLTTAPELPATTLTNNCYNSMFNGCTNLNYIKAMFTTTPSIDYTRYWVNGVASSGTFVKNSAATWTTTGISAVPSGWTIQTASA